MENKNINKDKKLKEKKSFSHKKFFTFKAINKVFICLIIVLGLSYMASMNDLAIKGFVLQDLKNESKKLDSDNNNIELDIMKLEAYENIDAKAKNLQMVKVDKIDYIIAVGSNVAKK